MGNTLAPAAPTRVGQLRDVVVLLQTQEKRIMRAHSRVLVREHAEIRRAPDERE